MKRFFSLILSMLLILSLCACGGGSKEDPNVLQAGFARVICLPDDQLVYIAGGTAAEDPATDGVLDELAETCIALRQGGETYLIFTCDVVDIDGKFCKITDKAISEATGIPEDKIILNATHTHSAPTLKDNLPGRDNYLNKFNDACAQAAKQAIADLSPATLSYGSIMTENMVRVRHYWMNDGTSHGNGHGTASSGYKEHMYPSDEECQVIRISRPAEVKKDIVMFNLAAHATMASGTNTSSLSADFPGYARTYIEDEADVHCAYFIAAGGDSVPNSKIPGEVPNNKNLNAYGEQLGNYVLQALESMTDAQGSDISLYSENLYAKKGSTSIYTPGEVLIASQCQTFPTNTMTVGSDVGIVFFPGELFSTQGRQLKDESPMAMTFVITNSEQDQMYFPNAIAFEHKFYESKTTKYAQGTGEMVAARYVEILTAMKEGKTPEPQPIQ